MYVSRPGNFSSPMKQTNDIAELMETKFSVDLHAVMIL